MPAFRVTVINATISCWAQMACCHFATHATERKYSASYHLCFFFPPLIFFISKVVCFSLYLHCSEFKKVKAETSEKAQQKQKGTKQQKVPVPVTDLTSGRFTLSYPAQLNVFHTACKRNPCLMNRSTLGLFLWCSSPKRLQTTIQECN